MCTNINRDREGQREYRFRTELTRKENNSRREERKKTSFGTYKINIAQTISLYINNGAYEYQVLFLMNATNLHTCQYKLGFFVIISTLNIETELYFLWTVCYDYDTVILVKTNFQALQWSARSLLKVRIEWKLVHSLFSIQTMRNYPVIELFSHFRALNVRTSLKSLILFDYTCLVSRRS